MHSCHVELDAFAVTMAAAAAAETAMIMKSLANIFVSLTMMMSGIGLFMDFNRISNGLMHFLVRMHSFSFMYALSHLLIKCAI